MADLANLETGSPDDVSPAEPPSIGELARQWLTIGLLSFGGPAAQMALMHRVLVEERRWLSERQYLNALGFCLLLPGPEAMQLATYSGWRLHGVRGGLLAGGLFVLPGAIAVALLAIVYVTYGELAWVQSLFVGIQAAVVVIVVQALLRVSRKALVRRVHWLIAAVSFAGIFFIGLPFPLIVVCAGVFGFLWLAENASAPAEDDHAPLSQNLTRHTLSTIARWLTLWFLPLGVLWLLGQAFLLQLGVYFSQLAVVSFGGAYAVLAYLAQAAVADFAWLDADAMMAGLGLAETTPGPLILVTEFVGFMAGHRVGGLGVGLLAAALTLWATFVPCFLWIFAGAPYLDWISRQPRLRGALSAITAAVVGVMLNLSLWFALHVWFADVRQLDVGVLHTWVPVLRSLDGSAVALSILCAFLMLRLGWGLVASLLAVAAVALVVV